MCSCAFPHLHYGAGRRDNFHLLRIQLAEERLAIYRQKLEAPEILCSHYCI